MKILLSVALGGAVGAAARYLLGSHLGTWFGHGFPWTTLTVNIVGSFVLGVFVALSALAVGGLFAGLRLMRWVLA